MGASSAPNAHRPARVGRFHLGEKADSLTRIGLSNLRDLFGVEMNKVDVTAAVSEIPFPAAVIITAALNRIAFNSKQLVAVG